MLTVEDIYAAIERREEAKSQFRRWLGASGIGHECERNVAMTFRCASKKSIPGVLARVFEIGHKAEDRLVADLEAAGCVITGRQTMYDNEKTLGHSGVTPDGFITFPDGTNMLLEFKTHNAASFRKLAKEGVKSAKPMHWAQVQYGMRLTGMKQAFYVAENKDTAELYVETVAHDEAASQRLYDLAVRLTVGEAVPESISEDGTNWQCKFCDHMEVCNAGKIPRLHCLTCCFSTPTEKGSWTCSKCSDTIPDEVLQKGCDDHVYLPWMLPHAATLDATIGSVTYRLRDGKTFCNAGLTAFPTVTEGEGCKIITSADMLKAGTIEKVVA